MGSEVLGNGKDDSKPIPKFRSQIKSATKTPDTSAPNNDKN